MNLAKHTIALAGAFSLSASLAQGQYTFLAFSDTKNYKQEGPQQFSFVEGSWDILVRDGQAFYVGCAGNGSPFPMFPIVPDCPLGTTALIDAGDLDGDGVRDGGTFWSITSIIPASTFAPFRSDYFSFEAGPPSKLPRPFGGTTFKDDSVVLFYDYINAPQSLDRYVITWYESSRPYPVSDFDKQVEEIVPGTYQFRLAREGVNFNNPDENPYIYVNVTHLEMIEAYPGLSFVPVGNEFNVTNDDAWRNGVMEIDPRLTFDFTWEGFNFQTVLGTDTTFFSLKERGTDLTLFPPYFRGVDPFTGTALLPEAFRFPQEISTPSTGFDLGPFFFEPGEQVYAELDYRRNNQSTPLTRDTSRRFFRWDINFVDTYEGFRFANTFPDRTLESLTLADADYDGDGMTNLEEFALQTDPVDPASVEVPTPIIDPGTGQCVLTIPKRPFTGGGLIYQVEYSSDLVNWTTIGDEDPIWVIQNDEVDVYRVRTRLASPPASCITRVRITTN
ncbi:hypothetical protein N9A86_04520 [Akkermansiaceae bacterium]|nr:hypothetical protein [Akkermansiaceae bacterium]MDB4544865.1 hypothetical protein [Akkermansiaceae bacterium]